MMSAAKLGKWILELYDVWQVEIIFLKWTNTGIYNYVQTLQTNTQSGITYKGNKLFPILITIVTYYAVIINDIYNSEYHTNTVNR